MKKFLLHRKGVLALLLTLFAGMGTAYAYSFSKVCSTGQTLYYNITNASQHYVEIVYPGTSNSPWGGYTQPSGNITLPSTVSYNGVTYTVKAIGEYAFWSCWGLTGSLTIPNSVTSIGDEAFYDCDGFTGNLTIGNSVTTIGEKAFWSCYDFKGSLTIPNSVTTIKEGAFLFCRGFTGSLTIGTGVTSIGSSAFSDCTGFTQVKYNAINCADVTDEDKPFKGCGGTLTIGSGVQHIPAYMFYNCTGFTGTLTIPNSVTSIGECAFFHCSGFTGSLTIPNPVTSIGGAAFASCYGITQVKFNAINCADAPFGHTPFGDCVVTLTIGSGVQRIPAYMFCGADFTGSLTIPNSVTSIGDGAFYDCNGFTGSLTIPSSVTSIGNAAFGGCSGFTGSLTIPNSVTTMGNAAFRSCHGFTGNLTIGNSVTSIGDEAFQLCSGFTGNLTIGNSVTSIGDEAFWNCEGFTGSLTIPNSVTTIGDDAFENCSNFTGNLTIGNSVTSIGYYAFEGCNQLSSMTALPETPPSVSSFAFSGIPNTIPIYVPCGSLSAYQNATGWNAFTNIQDACGLLTYSINPDGVSVTVTGHVNGTDAIGALIIPATTTINGVTYTVTKIGDYAFYGCSGLTGTPSIPNSVTTIGDYAFASCSGFTGSLTIPNSVTIIGECAFDACYGFSGTLTIGNSVTTIGVMAFYGLDGFTSLTLGNSLTTIGGSAFASCAGFTGSLTIPNSVTTIGDYAFEDCDGFTGTLTLGNSVTSIGGSAFSGCSGFTGSLTIPNSVTSIGDYAFYYCAGFTGTLTIGTGVTSIGTSAFKDCNGFSQVRFNATNCADADYRTYPFENCTGTLVFGSNVTRIPANMFAYGDFTGSISIPNAVTTIGYSAFFCCYNLNSYLSLGTSLTTIGIYAFYSCNGLTGTLTIPNSVTTLDIYAFALCSGFTKVTIGSAVTTINYGAFYGCDGLTSMTLLPDTPPTLGDDVFYGVPRSIPVYVPCSASDVYEVTPVWNEFDLQCRPVVTVTAVPTEGGSVSGGGTFDYGTQCAVTATPNSGYLFMHWSKNGEVVSSDATYSFYVYDDTDIEAVFMPQWTMGTVIGEGESSNENLPSNSFYRYTLTEQIYTADELGGSRTISNISFFNAGSTKTRSFDIYMRHTTKTSFSSTTEWVSVSSSYKVFSGTVEMRAGQWTTIVLNTPFTYNGTSNLLLAVDDNTGSYLYGMSCRVYDANGTQAIYVRSDNTNFNPGSPSSYTGTLLSVKNQIMLNRPFVYYIDAVSANTTAGTVTGGGTYGDGDICRLKATAKSGYTFLNWTDEDGVTVSTDANYSFTVTGNRSLTANFLSGTSMCSLTFDLFDSYGDGWNGNILVVDYEDGTSVNLTVSDDYNETYTLPFVNGSHVDLSWIEGGWSYECSFIVLYEEGDVMYMGSNLDEDYVYGFDMDCAGQSSDVTYLGDHSTANNYYLPSYSYYNFSLSEQIYTAEEIGMEGYITSMAFYNSGAQETRYYDIYLATTDKTTFENETDWINASDAVLVFSGEVTMQSGKWTPIKFNEDSFDYDGVSNLVLIVDDNTADYTSSPHMSCLVYETQSLQALRVYSDGYDYNPMSPPTSYANNEYHALMSVKNQIVFGMVPCYEPTDLIVSYTTSTSADIFWNSSHHNEFDVRYGLVNPNTDFEDGFGYWTTIDADGDGYGWVPASATSGVYYSFNLPDDEGHNNSDNFAISGSYTNYTYSALTPDNYLVSPRVTLGGSITFWACAQDAGYAAEHFGVAVSTTSNSIASAFNTIQEWTLTAKSTGAKVNPETTRSGNRTQGAWYQYTVDLSAYAGQTGYVAIRHFGCTDEFLLDVDDITIVQPGITPTMTTISGITDTYVTLTDLTPRTQYEVRVRSNCGSGFYSDWVTTSFTTPNCDAIFVDAFNPFFEGFENGNYIPDCWESIPTVINNNEWIILDHSHTGSFSACSDYYGNIYLVLPNIELSANAPAAQLSFWSYNIYPNDFEVGNNTVVLLNGGTETVLWSAEDVIESWVKTTIDLSAYLGQTVSLAFKYGGDNGNGWYVDDVEVSVPSNVTQTIALTSGSNWFSTYVDITLEDLQNALVAALPNATSITIKGRTQSSFYNGTRWRGALSSLDLALMYQITVPQSCEITLEGMPIDPAEHPVTIKNGPNWIGFPFSASMTPTVAFGNFPISGDKIQSKSNGQATYSNRWRGALTTLVPGQGYIYQSNSAEDRVFTFPTGAK